jgi:hypothetical protein
MFMVLFFEGQLEFSLPWELITNVDTNYDLATPRFPCPICIYRPIKFSLDCGDCVCTTCKDSLVLNNVVCPTCGSKILTAQQINLG